MTQGFNAPGVVKPFGIFSSAAWQSEGRVLKISGHVSQDAEGRNVGQGDMEAQTPPAGSGKYSWGPSLRRRYDGRYREGYRFCHRSC